MMEALVKQMLLGTSKLPQGQSAPSGDEVHDLVAKSQPADAETQLLLAVGAGTAFALAGRKALTGGALPEAAPTEDLLVPSSRAAGLLQELLTGEHRDLLPEALTYLRRAGMRLPDQLLAVALDIPAPDQRTHIICVLGGRGRWLSRFNPDWAWVSGATAAASETLPAEAEEVWDSAPIDQREAVLRRLRTQDPTQAREWLKTSWPGEKAEHRGRLLGVLAAGLSPADEPFLVEVLADRAPRVRAEAAGLLVRLPGSAFLQQLCERVYACITHKAAGTLGSKLKSLVGRKHPGELAMTPPEEVEAAWKKEGIIPPPPNGVGPRAWWLSRMLALIPPGHWAQRFGLGPDELLHLTIAEEWETAVVAGWTHAALLHGAREWLPVLWDYWMGAAGLRGDERLMGTPPGEVLGPVLAQMAPDEATPRIEKLIHEGREAPFGWLGAIKFLPRPWSAPVARTYLEHVRRRAKRAAQVANQEVESLPLAARAIPRECFAEALSEWAIPEGNDYLLQCWRREVDRFIEVVLLRQRIADALVCQESVVNGQ